MAKSRQFQHLTSPQILFILCSQLVVLSSSQYVGGGSGRPEQWGEWSVWSPCSSPCGPGIQTRSRQCGGGVSARPAGYPAPWCDGAGNQTRACEIKLCSTDKPSEHAVACSVYNTRAFSGKQYVWEPFTHKTSPCKLACRARGKHFYANLAGRRPDGSPCGKGSAEAICVSGACKGIGCDGVIGSSASRDACGVCQGDGSSCQTISGIFTSTSLRRGLNDIISIPAGSSNINITELQSSRNLLLLQTFEGKTILNGGTRSPVSGDVRGAGTTFNYARRTRYNLKESIVAAGPTDVGLKLKLLLRGTNPGIMYSFNVPLEKSDGFLQQVNHRTRPVHIPSNEDAARERYGVSSLEASPGSSALHEDKVSSPDIASIPAVTDIEPLDKVGEVATAENEVPDARPEGSDVVKDGFSLNKQSYSDVQNEAADNDINESGAEGEALEENESDEEVGEKAVSSSQSLSDEDDDLEEDSSDESVSESSEGIYESNEDDAMNVDSSEDEDEQYEDSLGEMELDEKRQQEEVEEDIKNVDLKEEKHGGNILDDAKHPSADEEQRENVISDEDHEMSDDVKEILDDLKKPTLSTEVIDSESYAEGQPRQAVSIPLNSVVDPNEVDSWQSGSQEDAIEEEEEVNDTEDSNEQNPLNTVDGESPQPSSKGVGSKQLPKYSQSFTFGQRHKTINRDSSSRRSGVHQTKWSRAQEQRNDIKPSSVVSIGLQYVDDKNGNGNSKGPTLTIGGHRGAAPTRSPYYQAPQPTQSSAARINSRATLTTQPSAMRLPTRRIKFRGSRPRQKHHQQWKHVEYYRGGTSSRSSTSSKRKSYLERQREARLRQREAVLEARRRRQEEQRERYNQRLRAYQERLNQRKAEIAARRSQNRAAASRNAQTQWRPHSTATRRKSVAYTHPPSRSTKTQPQRVSQHVISNRRTSTQTASVSLLVNPKPPKEDARSRNTNRIILRPYGEDGIYAPDESTKITNDRTVSTPAPDNTVTDTRAKEIIQRRPPVYEKSPTEDSSGFVQPQILTSQASAKSRVVAPLQPAGSQPNIIPRVRSPGPLDNPSGGLRPSIVSALGGGDTQGSIDLTNSNAIHDSGPIYLKAELRPSIPNPATYNAINTFDSSQTAAYAWRISGLTDCTVTCGGGVQQTVVVCVDTTTQAVVTDENCRNVNRPDMTAIQCNKRPCSAEWSPGPWSSCSATCGQGQRTRFVTCQARVSPTLNLTVESSKCEERPRPAEREGCRLEPCSGWRAGNWSQCSARCGEGVRTRDIDCVSLGGDVVTSDSCTGPRPAAEQVCDPGPCGKGWFYQEWPDECPVECGEGEITRKIFCSGESGEVLPHDRCDPNQMPQMSRRCRASRPCGGHWFNGQWSKCNAACGPGQRSREVICVKSLPGGLFAVVGEENCLSDDKPTETETCQISQCAAEWYMTSWSQCSKTCDTGVKSRDVKCLSPDQTPSDQCPFTDRPQTREPCNTQRCQQIRPNSTRSKTNETSQAPADCTDAWSHCPMVKRTNLCKHGFYRKHCCRSCWNPTDS